MFYPGTKIYFYKPGSCVLYVLPLHPHETVSHRTKHLTFMLQLQSLYLSTSAYIYLQILMLQVQAVKYNFFMWALGIQTQVFKHI